MQALFIFMPAWAFLKIKKRIMQQFSWHLILYCPYRFIFRQSYCFYIIKISQNDLTWIRNLIFCTIWTFVLENSWKRIWLFFGQTYYWSEIYIQKSQQNVIVQTGARSQSKHICVPRPRSRRGWAPVHTNPLDLLGDHTSPQGSH